MIRPELPGATGTNRESRRTGAGAASAIPHVIVRNSSNMKAL